jgi:hypothetical protein
MADTNPSGFRKAPIRLSGLLHGPGEVSNGSADVLPPIHRSAELCGATPVSLAILAHGCSGESHLAGPGWYGPGDERRVVRDSQHAVPEGPRGCRRLAVQRYVL